MEFSLQMVFVCSNGDKTSLTISEVKEGLTKANVMELMDTIIANDVFESINGSLISKYSAQIIQKESTKWDLGA